MKKPEELLELIDELKNSKASPSASYEAGGKVVVYIGKGQLNITASDAVFLLDTEETVSRFYESIGCPDDCGIELHDFEIEEGVKTALDAFFSTVDEL